MRTILLTLICCALNAQSVTAVRAKKIVTGEKEIENGVILISDGKIKDIGEQAKIEIPWNASTLDYSQSVVSVGLVEAATWRGITGAWGGPTESVPNVPFLKMTEGINMRDPYFDDCLRQGITTVCVFPSEKMIFAGQAAAIRTCGIYMPDVSLLDPAGLMISLAPTSKMHKIAVMAEIRETLNKAAKKPKEEDDKKEDDAREKFISQLLAGKITPFIYCENDGDVDRALTLGQEYKLKPRLILGRDVYKSAKEIAKAKIPVALLPPAAYIRQNEESGEDEFICRAKIFADEKVEFSMVTSGESLPDSMLWYQAAVAIRYGVSRDTALEAITINPAKFCGVSDRIGTLEKGKDANFSVLTGDLLDPKTVVDFIYLEGKQVYDRKSDKKLQRLFSREK